MESVVMASAVEEISELWRRGSLTSPEAVLLFVMAYMENRQTSAWCMPSGVGAVDDGGLDFKFEKLSPRFDFLKNLEAENFTAWITRYKLRKLPEAILRILLAWRRAEVRLTLAPKAISPEEMLMMQARGERVVTLAFDVAKAGECVDGTRDAFEFLLHDLVHADLFFGEGHLDQRRFFQSVQDVLKAGVLDQDLFNNHELRNDFHYLISDMNSHVRHLTQHLGASLLKHQLHLEGKEGRARLSSEGRQRLTQRLAHFQELGKFAIPLVSTTEEVLNV